MRDYYSGIHVCTSVTELVNIFCNIHCLKSTDRFHRKLLMSLLSNQKVKTNRNNAYKAFITQRIRILIERTKSKDLDQKKRMKDKASVLFQSLGRIKQSEALMHQQFSNISPCSLELLFTAQLSYFVLIASEERCDFVERGR